MRNSTTTAAVALAFSTALAASAEASTFRADLMELNGSGVSGRVVFDLSPSGETLSADVDIKGAEADREHLFHIHGRLDDGMPIDSVTPTLADDADGDGFVTLEEGAPGYGGILVPLLDGGTTPMAGPDGSISFMENYDLTDPATFFGSNDASTLGTDLTLREIVLHGLTVDPTELDPASGAAGRVGPDGYLATLPVGAAEIQNVPLPAAAWMLLAGLGGLGVLARRRG
jgi:hypothetical protein